jgi:NAD(P)-dependent dehydrogenase (short-subunit alcohol dehydrogenase family)
MTDDLVDGTSPLGLDGRVAVVTGAGAGLGRAEAVALAQAGAHVVLNDLPGAADEAAEEIRGLGGAASVVPGDVGERSTADALLAATAEDLGRLDIVVNNAGVVRDRMLFNMSDEEWDLVLKVHLRGHFLLSRNAASHWRSLSKSTGGPVYGRVVNTASEAFLIGSPGQPNYAAAKGGITALTLSTARGLGRAGGGAPPDCAPARPPQNPPPNAICPRARTAMTADVFGDDESGSSVDPLSPEHVAPLVAYLASPAAERITGQVFVVYGGMVALLAAPTVEQRFDASGDVWDLADLDKQVGSYFTDRDPAVGFAADAVMNIDAQPLR